MFFFFSPLMCYLNLIAVSLSKQNIDDYTVCKTKYYRTLFTGHVHRSVKWTYKCSWRTRTRSVIHTCWNLCHVGSGWKLHSGRLLNFPNTFISLCSVMCVLYYTLHVLTGKQCVVLWKHTASLDRSTLPASPESEQHLINVVDQPRHVCSTVLCRSYEANVNN